MDRPVQSFLSRFLWLPANSRVRTRLGLVILSGCLLGFALFLAVKALSGSVSYYLTPSELVSDDRPLSADSRVRLGGMVVRDSLIRDPHGRITFRLTDQSGIQIPVVFFGSPPSLLVEGSGAVVDGLFDGQVMTARSILAKHDESYRPPGVEEPSLATMESVDTIPPSGLPLEHLKRDPQSRNALSDRAADRCCSR